MELKRGRNVRPFSMFEPTEVPMTSLRKNQSSDDLVRDAQVRRNENTNLTSLTYTQELITDMVWLLLEQHSLAFNSLSLFYLSSLLQRLLWRCLLLCPPNQKDQALYPMANQVSTQAPSQKPNPIASNPRQPKAAALFHPYRARHFLYPPSKTLHLQLRCGPSPLSCLPPKPTWISPRPQQAARYILCTQSNLVQGSLSSRGCRVLSTGPKTAPMDLSVVRPNFFY